MPLSAELNVPFLDIKEHNRRIDGEISQAIARVVSAGEFILGSAVERFESAFADYIGVGHCVGVNSGTSALHLALQACDIGPGDEVITTPHTWISTAWAISYVGATPVFVDIDPETYNMNPDLVEKALTPRTKALLPVHLYGQACDLGALCRIANEHKLILIEDAAQAHGAVYEGRRVGSFGKAACFSFYPGKNLGGFGESGCVVTDDEAMFRRLRRLRDHAQDGRHNHTELGYNARMDGIQGAVLDVKLRHLEDWNALRRQHAEAYQTQLTGITELKLPACSLAESHVWHLFVVLLRSLDRDVLRDSLAERRVASGLHYPRPVHLQPAYAHLGYQAGSLPVAEDVMSRCLSLPLYPEMTVEQVEYVVEQLKILVPKIAQ